MVFLNYEHLEALNLSIRQSCWWKKVSSFVPGRNLIRDSGIRSGIYFVVCESVVGRNLQVLVKIGYTQNIRSRFCPGKGDNPADLYFVYFEPVFPATQKELRDIELEYHQRFKNFRVSGEWFDFAKVAKDMGWDWDKFIVKE